jgi:hypothetical protein
VNIDQHEEATMAEKKPKIGPRETQLREMREARASKPKRRGKAKVVARRSARGR